MEALMIAVTRTLLLAALAATAIPSPASAMEAHSTARLLDGGRQGEVFRAGVEITLDPGWKTYWRMPGESGVPPEFDWSKSANAAKAEVSYPAPHRFTDSGGEAIGYKERVVFPVVVTPADPEKPVDLTLTLHYAVCNDICIPARAELSRVLGGGSAPAAETALVREAATLVPTEEGKGIEVRDARLEGEGKESRLVVTLEGAQAEAGVDIFVEGFDDAYFRAPAAESEARFSLLIDGLKDRAALAGRTLTLTIVTPGARLVRQVRVE